MSLTEDSPMMSLFSDELSLWGPHDGAGSLDSSSALLKEGKGVDSSLDAFDPLSPESDVSCDNPMPDWMSEKVPLSAWLGDEEDMPMAELMTMPPSPTIMSAPLKPEELIDHLLEGINDLPAPSGEEMSDHIQSASSPSPSLDSEGLSMHIHSAPTSPLESAMEIPLPASGDEVQPVAAAEPTLLSIPDEGIVEAQALALLNALTGVDNSMLDTEVITIKLPPPTQTQTQTPFSDQTAIPEDQSVSCATSESLPFPPTPDSLPPSPPEPTPVKRPKSKPRLKNASPIDRKSRKRNQNKEAATRYRVKKREEARTVMSELDELEAVNKSLKDKVEGLSKEIQYLKDLLLEVRQLKGQIKTIQRG